MTNDLEPRNVEAQKALDLHARGAVGLLEFTHLAIGFLTERNVEWVLAAVDDKQRLDVLGRLSAPDLSLEAPLPEEVARCHAAVKRWLDHHPEDRALLGAARTT
ncbi:MAG: hypothetical protein HC923_05405 [Myxococcales bacterium]|nr:hypothetical protein [Myxococcales bacterium]